MTHTELVQRAIKWLENSVGCSAVASEMASAHWEIPDAIGWNSLHSWMVECKTNRSDFERDSRKHSRRHSGGIGNYRYYMTEPGLLDPDELPEGWGLLEVYPRIVRRMVKAVRFNDVNIAHYERPMLVSLVRRLTAQRHNKRMKPTAGPQ